MLSPSGVRLAALQCKGGMGARAELEAAPAPAAPPAAAAADEEDAKPADANPDKLCEGWKAGMSWYSLMSSETVFSRLWRLSTTGQSTRRDWRRSQRRSWSDEAMQAGRTQVVHRHDELMTSISTFSAR